MSQFWKASSVSVTNGGTIVTVTTGDDVSLVSPNSFLQISNNQFVEVKTVNTGASPQTIELFQPWEAGSLTNQSAIAAPTRAEIKAAADEIRNLRTVYESLASDVSVTPTANSVVKRDSSGRVKTATPNANDDAVNKGYVDGLTSTNTSDITSLDGRVTTNEGDITSLDGRVTTNEGDITSLDSRVTTVESETDINTAGLATVYDRVRKSLLDSPLCRLFLPNKIVDTLAGSLTSTRASTATYVDRYGVVRTAAVDEPREEKEGWLIEGASTNLLTDSEDFAGGDWSKFGTTVTANATTAPDGTSTADKLIENAGNSTHATGQLVSVTNGAVYSISLFAKAAERGVLQISIGGGDFPSLAVNFDLTSGEFLITASGNALTNDDVKMTQVANGFYRCALSVAAVNTDLAQINYLMVQSINSPRNESYAGDGTSGIYIWGAQLETLPFASSYIPTTTAPATRVADLVTAQTESNAPLTTEFSYSLNWSYLGYSTNNILFSTNYNGSTNETNATSLRFVSGNALYFLLDGGIVENLGVKPPNIEESVVISQKGGQLYTYKNGQASPLETVTLSPKSPASGSLIYFGSRSNGSGTLGLYGHLRDFRIYDFALNADEAQFLAGVK